MITNCLDVKNNQWDDNKLTPSGQNAASNSLSTENATGTQLGSTTSAQNCHREADPTEAGGGNGWNNVTPW